LWRVDSRPWRRERDGFGLVWLSVEMALYHFYQFIPYFYTGWCMVGATYISKERRDVYKRKELRRINYQSFASHPVTSLRKQCISTPASRTDPPPQRENATSGLENDAHAFLQCLHSSGGLVAVINPVLYSSMDRDIEVYLKEKRSNTRNNTHIDNVVVCISVNEPAVETEL
jgi:hypothetical protein